MKQIQKPNQYQFSQQQEITKVAKCGRLIKSFNLYEQIQFQKKSQLLHPKTTQNNTQRNEKIRELDTVKYQTPKKCKYEESTGEYDLDMDWSDHDIDEYEKVSNISQYAAKVQVCGSESFFSEQKQYDDEISFGGSVLKIY